MLRKLFGRFIICWSLLVFLQDSFLLAGESFQAEIEGKKDKVILKFDETFIRVIKLLVGIEKKAKERGISLEFRLGAGDLRRAILGQPTNGPGDFELFAFVHSLDIKPRYLSSFIRLIKRDLGIDLENELRAILGKDKELDIYYKDKLAIQFGFPFRGGKGEFDGMESADTSLNQLSLSVSDLKLHGHLKNLNALKRKKILFTEPEKAKRLKSMKKITGASDKTWYDPKILRIALRSLRLKLDLEVAENPNELTLDSSFDIPLRGFEVFFEKASDETISDFSLDEIYLGLFLKIFKNRSPEDLKKIEGILKRDHGKTLEIWKKMNLRYEYLVSPPESISNYSASVLAILDHVRFNPLRPFVKKDGVSVKITNPFDGAQWSSDLMKGLKQKGIDASKMKHIPRQLLRLYDPRLLLMIDDFENLSLDEKNSTIKGYRSALLFFSAPAGTRILQSKFITNQLNEFSFVDTSDSDLEMPFQDYLLNRLQISNEDLRRDDSSLFNDPVQTAIDKQAAAILERKKTPVLFVDLDETLVNMRPRIFKILKDFDKEYETSWFSDLRLEDIPADQISAFLKKYMAWKAKSFAEYEEASEKFSTYFKPEIFSAARLKDDAIFRDMADRLSRWSNGGMKIVFVTQRSKLGEGETKDFLARNSIEYLDLLMIGGEEDKDKASSIQDYLREHPDLNYAGFIDNKRAEVDSVLESLGAKNSFQIVSRWNNQQSQFETVFVEKQEDLIRALGTKGLRGLCTRALKGL